MHRSDPAPISPNLNRTVVRVVAYWLAATAMLWAGSTPISANWGTRLVYLIVGSNCMVLLSCLANWYRPQFASSHLAPGQAASATMSAAMEVVAVVLITLLLSKLLH